MINVDQPIPTIYYSPYGYIEVDKNEINNSDSLLITFKKSNKMTGKINVNIILKNLPFILEKTIKGTHFHQFKNILCNPSNFYI